MPSKETFISSQQNTSLWQRYLAFIVLYFFVACLPSFAQTKRIDSLKDLIRSSPSPQQTLTTLRQLLDQRNALSTDTIYYYAVQLKQLANSLKDEEVIQYAEQDIALYYASKKRIDTALHIISIVLQNVQPDSQHDLYLSLLLSHARLLYRNNQYKESLQELFGVANTAEKWNNTPYQVMAKTGIGWLQLDMKQYSDALQWFHKALYTPGSNGYLEAYSPLYSNLATTHQSLGNTDSAIYYIRKAIDNARKHESLGYLGTSLRIYADILMHQKKYAGAEEALKEMVEIRKHTDASFFVNYDMSLLANFYAQTGQTQKGIALCKAVIDSAHKSGITTQLYLMYDALAANYKAGGEYKAYGETLEKSKAFQDSLYTMNTGQLIAALQSQNEIQKKENIIIQQKLDIVQKKLWLYVLLAFVVFAGVLIAVLFRQYRKRQVLKMQLLQQEEKRRAEKAVMQAEETERKRIAADLHDSLGAYAASIASNIDHLRESAPEGSNYVLKELRTNAQAIVAQLSDTIWVLKKDALSLTAISDRLKLFIQKIAPSYPTVTIDVCEEIETDYLLPPSHAFQLFQIIKEALNNALRHSRCRQISIKVEGKQQWRLSIRDDGGGFMQSTTVAEGGSGLINMKARAQESGWTIQWRTNQPKGTSVIIEPTTN